MCCAPCGPHSGGNGSDRCDGPVAHTVFEADYEKLPESDRDGNHPFPVVGLTDKFVCTSLDSQVQACIGCRKSSDTEGCVMNTAILKPRRTYDDTIGDTEFDNDNNREIGNGVTDTHQSSTSIQLHRIIGSRCHHHHCDTYTSGGFKRSTAKEHT